MKKILIIHTAYIGDIILSTPMIPAIKQHFPDCLLDFVTIPASANLLEEENELNELIIFDKKNTHRGIKGLKSIIHRIKLNNYDICICPHRSLRSAILSKFSKAELKIGFSNSVWAGAFTNTVAYKQELHETKRNLSLLEEIGIKISNTRPVIKENGTDINQVESLLKDFGITNEQLFAVAPGSVWPTKRWGIDKYIQLTKKLQDKNFKSILVGGKQDASLCEYIVENSNSTISLAGRMSLRQTKYFLTKCRGLVTNDSAPLHLGLAARIPVFSIFGPTIPGFGFAPIESDSYVMENTAVHCRPCGIHGSHQCPVKTFDCMEKIYVEDVMNKIETELH